MIVRATCLSRLLIAHRGEAKPEPENPASGGVDVRRGLLEVAHVSAHVDEVR